MKETYRLRVWVDATDTRSTVPLFGITLLERQLQAIKTAGLTPTEVCIGLPVDSSHLPALPEALTKSLPLRWLQEPGSLQERLVRAVHEANGEPLLVVEADAVADTRLLQYLAEQTGSLAAC